MPKSSDVPKPGTVIAGLGELGDLPPVERGRHGSVILETRERTLGGFALSAGARVLDDSPLSRYLERAQIDAAQFEAGTRFGATWRSAWKPPQLGVRYDGQPGGGMADGYAEAAALDARRRLAIWMRIGRLAEPAEAGALRLTRDGAVVVAVCGLDEWAGGTRRLEALRRGLDGLVSALGLTGRQDKAPMRAALAPDARPSDQPEARDLSWVAEQNRRRRRKLGLDDQDADL